jgi:hypothetical protein
MMAPATRFGVYEVVGPLGTGGMGEGYRAREITRTITSARQFQLGVKVLF